MRALGITQLLLACALILGMAAGIGRAAAQSGDGRGVEAFSRAVKAYESSDWNEAAAAVDDAMQAGLSKDLQARAFHLRAHINERSGALARALQDYSTALWMDTLPQSERQAAKEGKQRVIAAMGLTTYAPGAGRTAAVPEAASQSSSGGTVWSIFNVFGSSSSSPQPAPAPPPARTAAAAPEAEPPAPASAAVSRPKRAAAKSATRTAPPKPARVRPARAARPAAPPPVRIASIQPAAAPVSSSAGFMIMFGAVSSEAAGNARAQQIKAALSDILVSRTVDVEAGAAGGYQIVAGPYKAKSAAVALCSVMKQRGVACQVTP